MSENTADSESTDPKFSADADFLRHEFNRLRAELASMKDRLSGNASDALGQVNTYLHSDDAAARLKALEKQFDELSAKLKVSGKEALGKLETKVEERPLTSIAVAFGVGLLAANLFRRP
jgi:ElaB/YqjD/DUF883 family membrane-anchored ribosome-binding protein